MQPSVLVMEDDINLIRLYSKALKKGGFDVYKATTLDDARTLLRSQRFDVFICDMRMGAEDGGSIILEHYDLLSNEETRVIVISAEETYSGFCQKIGMGHFLAKPVYPGSLMRIAQQLIEQPTSQQARTY